MGIVRKTKSVRIILEAFESEERAKSVVELIKQFEDQMNKTTVYRILERLEEEGVLHSFIGKDGLKWFAKYRETPSLNYTNYHPHFQCSGCGKSECLTIDISIPTVPNHRIDTANLLLIGQCSDCLSKS